MKSNFLEDWDALIEHALANNEPAYLAEMEDGEVVIKARTRHPAFMGRQPVKHDPERDSK